MTSPIEILHVLYADAVGYSKLSFESRAKFDDDLSHAVNTSSWLSKTVARVDNGDGFALVFRGDPTYAAGTAIEIRQRLKTVQSNPVRFSLHSGPAYLRTDLSGNVGISGPAIEQAQRLMVHAAPWQILCSQSIFLMLQCFPDWSTRFSGPTMVKTKHDDFLIAHGLQDRHKSKLLCICFDQFADLTRSEMYEVIHLNLQSPLCLWGEIERISDQFDRVIVGESVDFDPISSFVSGLKCPVFEAKANWTPAQVNAFLIEGFENTRLKSVGENPVPLDSGLYVRRNIDTQLEQSILDSESIILLKGSRKSGKTSLIMRGVDFAKKEGFRTCIVDFEAADSNAFSTAESFYRWVISNIIHSFDSDIVLPSWDSDLGPNSNFEASIRSLLVQSQSKILLVLDRVDKLWKFQHRDDFFGLLRSWHNRRAISSDDVWQKLSVLISYSGDSDTLVRDINQSPFNVGRRFEILPLTREEIAKICPIESNAVFDATGGHPLLVQLILAEKSETESYRWQEIIEASQSLQSIKQKLLGDKHLFTACKNLLMGKPCPHKEAVRLIQLGLFAPDTSGILRPTSRLMSQFMLKLIA